MAKPTLIEVFGPGALQDSNYLTIAKSSLAQNSGLTALSSNSPEGLLAAVLLQAAKSLTEDARATEPAIRQVAVSYNGQDLIEQGGQNFRRDVYIVALYTPTQVVSVDPDNY